MDYFNRRRGDSATAHTNNDGHHGPADAPPTPQRTGARYVPGAPLYESLPAQSAIRIRRLPSSTTVNTRPATAEEVTTPVPEDDRPVTTASRHRSSSAPLRPHADAMHASNLSQQKTHDGAAHLPAITEGRQITTGTEHAANSTLADRTRPAGLSLGADDTPHRTGASVAATHSAGHAAQRSRGLNRFRSNTASTIARDDRPGSWNSYAEYDADVIDLLDLIDPEVRTIGTLTNLQNSLFVPNLGSLVDRRPTYELSRRPTEARIEQADLDRIARSRANTRTERDGKPSRAKHEAPLTEHGNAEYIELEEQESNLRRTISIDSELSDSRFAVLPHGVSLEGWSDEDVLELNDHVRHLLHSKREGFKRSMRGFKQYISKPLGLFVFVYATLVTLFGAAWVFCLIGWIYVGSKQDYFINVVDLILVALFALMGDGLAPFRAVDTYHMCFIAHYHHLTWRLRRERALPNLVDHNDLPERRNSRTAAELEDAIDKEEIAEYSVLSVSQQKRLAYHQAKFHKSHTFYKPHETATHHAFPIRLLIGVVVLLDCHSLFQVALGTCTWSIDYHVRPQALTATILSCSITCNIMAGVLISIGDHKTRKKDVLERIFRQGLTEQALKRMAKTKERGRMSLAVDRERVESEHIKSVAQSKAMLANAGRGNARDAPEGSRDWAKEPRRSERTSVDASTVAKEKDSDAADSRPSTRPETP